MLCGGDGGEFQWCSREFLDDVSKIGGVCLNKHGVWVGSIAWPLGVVILVAHGGGG